MNYNYRLRNPQSPTTICPHPKMRFASVVSVAFAVIGVVEGMLLLLQVD